VNPRNEYSRYVDDAMSLTHFSVDEGLFKRRGLFDGQEQADLILSDHLLKDANTGLASVAIVQDPLIGEAVQVRSALYQRIATWKVYGLLTVFVLWSLAVLSHFVASIAAGLFALIHRLRGSATQAQTRFQNAVSNSAEHR